MLLFCFPNRIAPPRQQRKRLHASQQLIFFSVILSLSRLGECSNLCREVNLFYSDSSGASKIQCVVVTLSQATQMEPN